MATSDSFDLAAMKAELTRDEGSRRFPYYDSGNRMTVGVGRDISDNGLRPDEISLMLDNDIRGAAADLDHNIPWWRTLDPVRQRAMLNLTFNLGWTKFSQFCRFLSAMNQHRWDDAAIELIGSRWHSQVGDRATRIEEMVRTGQAV